MEACDWLKHASDNGKKPVTQTVFEGKLRRDERATQAREGVAVV
jgi:hypothetical protein